MPAETSVQENTHPDTRLALGMVGVLKASALSIGKFKKSVLKMKQQWTRGPMSAWCNLVWPLLLLSLSKWLL